MTASRTFTTGNFNYSDCNGRHEVIDKAWEFATTVLNLPEQVNIDLGDNGQDIIRISAVMPDNTGYNFTTKEIKRFWEFYNCED